MSDPNGPDMSVVLVTADRYDAIRKMIGYLQRQTIADRLEVVIVAPSRRGLELAQEDLRGFHGYQVVEVGEVRTLSEPRAEGVRHAAARVVALTEDHCYPEPGWAEAMVEAHRGPWAAVGPAIGNANPPSRLSRLQLLVGYGNWVDPKSGVVDDVPGNNSCYKRSVLLDYGTELAAVLGVPYLLHKDLRAKGYQLSMEPRARLNHLNVTRLATVFRENYWLGRRFDAGRAARWTVPRRLVYATIGIPWILLQYLRSDLGKIRRSAWSRELIPAALPTLLYVLASRGIGEFAGFALGAGRSVQMEVDIDTRRYRYLSRRDRALVGEG